jgi:hypothetical protein
MTNVVVVGTLDNGIDPSTWIKEFITRNDYYVVDYDHRLNIHLSTSEGVIPIKFSMLKDDSIADLGEYVSVVLYCREDQGNRDQLEKRVRNLGCKTIIYVCNGYDGESIRYDNDVVIDSSRQKGIGGFTLLARTILRKDDASLVVKDSKTDCLIL